MIYGDNKIINESLDIINKDLIQLCEGDIFDIHLSDKDNIFLVAKESKDIKQLKNVVQQNKINIYCCSLSKYQIKFLHHLSFRSKHLRTEKCGCFYCLSIFNSKQLDEVNDGIGGWCDFDDTPICPYCGIDTVLFEGKNLKITREFLYDMELNIFGQKFDLKNWKQPMKPILVKLDI